MKKRRIIWGGILQGVILTFLFTSDLQAQYTTAIGTRTGGTSGVTARYIYEPGRAVEGILGSFGNGFSLTGLIEKYEPIYYVKGLYVYHGGGLHVAVYDNSSLYHYYGPLGREVNHAKNNSVGFGINLIAGVEYRMPRNIPLAFTVDLKPFLEIGSVGRISVAPDPSIGVKFIIR